MLVAVAGYFFYGRERPPLPTEIQFVCVSTGEVFNISRDKVPNILPAKNPKTGQMTLLPVSKHDDGKLYVGTRRREELKQLGEVNHYVDPKTLEVRKL